MNKYAEKTTVSVPRSKAQIEELVIENGAKEYATGYNEEFSFIGFKMNNRHIKLFMPNPDTTEREITHTETGRLRKKSDQESFYKQSLKQKWRALYLIIRAKLEAVNSGIVSFDEEFMAHIALPDGHTIGEHISPQILHAYETKRMPALLPGFNETKLLSQQEVIEMD